MLQFRLMLTTATIVTVVAMPLAGAAWSVRHAVTTVMAATHRELVFTEVLLGVLTALLAAILGWLTVASVVGAATGVRQLAQRSGYEHARPRRATGSSPRAAGPSRRRGGSAAAAAVTALVLLAAGTQAASAAAAPTPVVPITALSADMHDGPVATADPARTPAGPDESAPDGPDAPATVVGGWTPRVSPMSPATAALLLGAPAAPTAQDPTTAALHVVLRGESLWSIVADRLGPGATATEISTAWPRWWQANRDVIGDDPDLIHAGQQLRPPA